MKTNPTTILQVSLLLALLCVIGCNQSKTADPAAQPDSQASGHTQNSPAVVDTPEIISDTVAGRITEIKFGKDGYTAKILTDDKATYAVTISRANLDDPSQYKQAAIGDIMKVSGDSWMLEGQRQITVRQIHE